MKTMEEELLAIIDEQKEQIEEAEDALNFLIMGGE